MDKSPQYNFVALETALKCTSSKDRKDQLLQYNLDKNLQITKCRFTGSVPKTSTDYDQIIAELLSSSVFLSLIGANSSSISSVPNNAQQLRLSVTSMAFFDRLNDSGIKRCTQCVIQCTTNMLEFT